MENSKISGFKMKCRQCLIFERIDIGSVLNKIYFYLIFEQYQTKFNIDYLGFENDSILRKISILIEKLTYIHT